MTRSAVESDRVVTAQIAWLFVAASLLASTLAIAADQPNDGRLDEQFRRVVRPFLNSHCLGCHGEERQEAKLNLAGFRSLTDVTKSHQIWQTVLERLDAGEMPPEDSERQPTAEQRRVVVDWIRAMRAFEAQRNAGDPGPVLARRLNNAEYNYAIRDLTGVDIRPTDTFPVDPANEAGFDNSGESLSMSPALLKKYLGAARQVVEHLVLTPTGIAFAPHPAVTDTDRDKYCVNRIVAFYQNQSTDLTDYFLMCWQYRENQPDGAADPDAGNNTPLHDLARDQSLSPKYAGTIWSVLHAEHATGPIRRIQDMWRALPQGSNRRQIAKQQCEDIRDYVADLRPKLSPKFDNITVEGSHKGSQPFVLWKNRQYASHRRKLDRSRLFVEGDEIPDGTPEELVLPANDDERRQTVAGLEQFCSVFPNAFYISERGRDYLDKLRTEEEKGRLLSAGFHSMMGYFRDDDPLCDMMLDDDQRRELDGLWLELDVVASAPTRQYSGFLWFERTDSRYMRDPVFDFARAEDKSAASEEMIQELSKHYLAKARDNGGSDVALKAIEDFFTNINAQIRRVDTARINAEPVHRTALLTFAERSWRRRLSADERHGILSFYRALRDQEQLGHEEAIQDTMVSILMSPYFCYRTELAGSGDGIRPLSDDELASRLSFFLWSTIPDERLLDAARSPEISLQDPAVVAAHAARMLDDGRVRALAVEFGGNWLDFRRFEQHNSVDRDRFPQFTDELRQAMFEEPVRFFVDVLRNDRSVLDFLNADHTFVNPVLAQHYGIDDVDFDDRDWVRVDQADRFARGGLLPMSVFLTKNAPGLRTSPVKRGYWVVRRLLGERIPAPPPNVPELPADESQLGELTLPDMLARHREHKSCAGCHDRFDSIGLVFEAYGPVGERRENDLGGRPVETQAIFPNGDAGDGLHGLRHYLREHRQQEFLDNLCRKLLSYALGRTLLLSDDPLVKDMRTNLKADGYRFSSLVRTIVTSRQFLYKRGREPLVREFQ